MAANRPQAQIRMGASVPGIERMEAHLHGCAYSTHRHDTYAVGITLSGVQSFHFRGRLWHSLPGQGHILHPDEPHDGQAGTADGFRYRIVYVCPSLMRDALQGAALPFVAQPIVDGTRLRSLLDPAEVWAIDGEPDELQQAECVTALASLLSEVAAPGRRAIVRLERAGLQRVRDCLAATPAQRHPMSALERLAGLDRWSLARQFRQAFGTSPSRFRTLRRLDDVRRGVRAGAPLADAALAAGFADQSHMTRQFRQAYGMTPARWAAAVSAGACDRLSGRIGGVG